MRYTCPLYNAYVAVRLKSPAILLGPTAPAAKHSPVTTPSTTTAVLATIGAPCGTGTGAVNCSSVAGMYASALYIWLAATVLATLYSVNASTT